MKHQGSYSREIGAVFLNQTGPPAPLDDVSHGRTYINSCMAPQRCVDLLLDQGISQLNQERNAIKINVNRIYNKDCLEGMKSIKDASVDMILTDLPYGITDCKWDNIIPFEPMWEQFERIIKERGAMVFTAAQPFTTSLIYSNKKHFRYCWYWIKNQVTGFTFAKYQPMRCIEDVVVFYKKAPTYNPQGLIRLEQPLKNPAKKGEDCIYRVSSLSKNTETFYTNYPRQTIHVNCQREGLHPTQKPVDLFEYLIKTYTNPGQLVLDACMGSGTTAVACINTGRNFIGFETDERYYNIALKRVDNL